MQRRIEVNTGDRYGRLTIIREAEPSGEKRHFLCRCECGTEKTVLLGSLRSGVTKSCGCLSVERSTTHGLSKHPIYAVWNQMRNRCKNPNDNRYYCYGARGITVCDEWKDSGTFMTWALANGWEPGLQIDRIDNDGNYTPENCRFVTPAENMRNSTVTKLNASDITEIKNLRKCGLLLHEIGDIYGVSESNIGCIINGKTWK